MSRLILSGRQSIIVVVVLSVILLASVAWGATHHRADTGIANCTMVLSREHGPRCLP